MLRLRSSQYVRARVKNVGEVGAANVEVSVVEVRRKGADGNFGSMPMGTPWNLVWAHIGSHVLAQLPVESERHIDVGHVIDPGKRQYFPGQQCLYVALNHTGAWYDEEDRMYREGLGLRLPSTH